MKYCSKCGKEVSDEADVCLNCGCSVNDKPAVSSAPVGQLKTNRVHPRICVNLHDGVE